MYSTLSSLATLMATALFLSAACPSLADDPPKNENNPDKICKYKKKCPSCDGNGPCDDSKPEDDIKTKTVGHDEECPDPVSAGFGEDYELVGGGTRSSNAVRTPVTIRSGFGPDFINLKNLNVYGQGAEIIRDRDTNVRQIKTDTGFLDVISMPETKTIELRQYKPEDIGSNKVNGVYPIKAGRIPLVVLRYVQEADNTIRVDTIDNVSEFPSVKSERTVQTVGPKPYTITQQKTYMKGEGLSAVEYRRVSKTIMGIPGGQPKEEQYFYITEDMGTDGQWHVIESKTGRRAEYKQEDGLVTLYECDAANEDGTPMNPIATETNYTYYTDPLQTKSYGKMRTLRRNNGYWENKYYDENANAGIEVEKTESPWLNTTAHEPGEAPAGKIRVREEVRCSTDSGVESLTETVDGIAITKEWTEKSQVNQQMVREVRHQPHSGGDKVTTTVRYRKAKDVPSHLTGKTVSVHNADGSMSLYSYALNGQDLTITQDTGYGEGDSVSHGTRMISTQDKDSGNLKEEVRYALEGGQAYWLGSRTGVNFDNKGVALKWVYNNDSNDYTEQRKDCCHVTWERGRDGIVTTYTYDAAGRKTSTTAKGIITKTEYEGSSTIQWRQIVGIDEKRLVSKIVKNLAGKTIEETTATVGNNALITNYKYNIPERSIIIKMPYGTNRQSYKTIDGKLFGEVSTTGLTTTYNYAPSSFHGGGISITSIQGERVNHSIKDLLGNTLALENSKGAIIRNSYNKAGRLVKSIQPDGEIQIYRYESDGITWNGLDLDGDGQLNPSIDRISRTLKTWDPTWPEGRGSWKTENQNAWQGNWVTKLTEWSTEDGSRKRIQSLGVEGYTCQEQPTPKELGNNYTAKSIMPNGTIIETDYKLQKGVIVSIETSHKDSLGNIIISELANYNNWGHIQTRVNSQGITRYQTDEITGIVIGITYPDNITISSEYDSYGRTTAVVQADGSRQYFVYDSEGRVTRQWGGGGQYPVSFEYNAYNQKTMMTTYRTPVNDSTYFPEQAEGDCTFWFYDPKDGALLRKQYADGTCINYTYTLGGKTNTLTNARGNITSYSYDIAGQQIAVATNDNGLTPNQRQSFDQWGRSVTLETEGAASYAYVYNEQGKLIREDIVIPSINGSLSRSIERFYDPFGRLSSYQLKHGDYLDQSIAYAYNSAGQLASITADGKIFTYEYVKNDRHLLAEIKSPVHTVTNIWDVSRNVLSKKVNAWKNKVDNTVISSYSYTVNNLGQRTSVKTAGEVFAESVADWSWDYDTLGQLTQANTYLYSYDSIGNRLTSKKENENLKKYVTNTLNQYTTINATQPVYDADGNLLTGLTSTATNPNRVSLTFTYNANNRPVEIRENGELKEFRTYDYLGRRIRKGDTITLYDGFNAIAEYNYNTRTLKSTFAWGNDLLGTLQGTGGVGGLLSVKAHDRLTPLISYPCYDGNGNITEYLTEENAGTVKVHYEYDSFGKILKKTGDIKYLHLFSTKPYDSITELNYYNYRDYDSVSGRWINRDPIEEDGSKNLYAFINNSVINNFDLFGLFCDDECSEGEMEFEDFQYNYHAALTNSENLTPDEVDELYSALDEIVDLVDLKKLGPLKLNQLIAALTEIQGEMAEAAANAIPKIMEKLKKRNGVVIWTKVKGKCCRRTSCCIFWDHLSMEDTETDWEKTESKEIMPFTMEEAAEELPSILEKQIKKLCN